MRSLLGIPSSPGNTLALTPLECADPRFRVLSPLECADPKTHRRNPFRMRSSEKRWGGGPASFFARHSFTPSFEGPLATALVMEGIDVDGCDSSGIHQRPPIIFLCYSRRKWRHSF